MTKIKICGMTRREDVIKAISLGVDAIGFILCKSKRQVTIKKVYELIKGIPPFISVVAVVVNPTEKEIHDIVSSNLFTCIQFHGDERPQDISNVPIRTIKAIGISSQKDVEMAKEYRGIVSAILFDTKLKDKKGGTGKSFDWTLLKNYKEDISYIVAGGIGYRNIEKLFKTAHPYGIDVNSSIEISPGIKDHTLMEKTIKKIRRFST